MFRVFYTHKKLGRYCIRTYQDTPLSSVISEVSAELSKPKFHNTFCDILDDTDKSVWQYQPIREKKEKTTKFFSASFSIEEYNHIMSVLKDRGISKQELIRKAIILTFFLSKIVNIVIMFNQKIAKRKIIWITIKK